MKIYRMLLVLAVIAIFLIPAAAIVTANDTAAPVKTDPLKDIIAACREAKSNFRPLTNDDLNSAKADLAEAAAKLDIRLKSDGVNGEAWRKYLLLETLQEELSNKAAPNRELLSKIYQRFASGNDGLSLIWFNDVQLALGRLLMIQSAVDNPQIKTLYEQNIDKLANQLASFAEKPTTENTLEISEAVRWLSNARQAADLVASVERQFAKPNLYVKVSEDFISAGLGEPVNDTTQICDSILGTDISGTGRTVGKSTAELTPDSHRAIIDNILFATTYSTTVGSHGPVCIYSNSTTNIGACKRLWVDENGLFSRPAVSNAVTQTNITDIQARRKIIERMAWKRAGKQKPKAEYVASRHAEQRVNDRIDAQAAETLDKAQADFTNKIRRPLVEHRLFPEQLDFSTDNQLLYVVSMEAGRSRLAALAPPPEPKALTIKGQADILVQVHESMINNFVLDAIGGMTVHEEKFQKAVIDLLGKLPEKMKGDEDQEPWAITFAKRQPISVTFADNCFTITIRGAEYFKNEKAYPAMNVTAKYKIETTGNGFKAVRQGDIVILPPGRTQVGGQEQVIRTLLAKRFGKVFEPEIVAEGFTFKGKWEKVGKMLPVEFDCRDGWLTIAWHRAPAYPIEVEEKVN